MSITLSMIVKNEEALLPGCLKSVKDWVDEIIIVDTGSSDNTVEVARSFGARVETFAWVDDFSAARNYAQSFVTTPWLLWLDADDLLMTPELLPEITEQARKKRCNGIWSIYKQDQACYQRRLQLFKTKDYQWQGFVHENPIPHNPALAESWLSDLVVLHRKPAERSPQAARKYLDILLAKDPTNWLGIAESYKFLSHFPDAPNQQEHYREQADKYYWQAYHHPDATLSTRYISLFNGGLINLEREDRKWLMMAHRQAQAGIALCPERAECWVLLGQTWECLEQAFSAVEAYQTALRCELPMNDIGLYYHGYYDEIPQLLLDRFKEKAQAEQEPRIIVPENRLILPK